MVAVIEKISETERVSNYESFNCYAQYCIVAMKCMPKWRSWGLTIIMKPGQIQ